MGGISRGREGNCSWARKGGLCLAGLAGFPGASLCSGNLPGRRSSLWEGAPSIVTQTTVGDQVGFRTQPQWPGPARGPELEGPDGEEERAGRQG